MRLFPAIDLRGGRCVRLHQGDFDAETIYSEDPAEVAAGFAAAGAEWLHVVDLDAARTGRLTNLAQVQRIVAASGLPVQYGGGVRSVPAAEQVAAAGVSRLVVGTAALEAPRLVTEIAARWPVALGLDVRGRQVAVRGWRATGALALGEVLAAPPPVEAVVVTQITSDGTLAGPDLGLLGEALAATELPIIASGGVGRPADLSALAALAVQGRSPAGVIVGRAIYEGAVDVAAAVRLLAGAGEEGSARCQSRDGTGR